MSDNSIRYFIVEAKLHQPRSAGQLVQLLRVQERLTQDVDRPFTLVAAPAGFGKTTLLCEWLRTTPRPSAWLSLDEHDNELPTFLAYLNCRHPPLSILGLPPVPFMLLPGVVLGQAVFAWSERRVAHNKTQLLVLEVLDTPEQRNAVYGSGGSQPPAHHWRVGRDWQGCAAASRTYDISWMHVTAEAMTCRSGG
jgi:hypothetical protein